MLRGFHFLESNPWVRVEYVYSLDQWFSKIKELVMTIDNGFSNIIDLVK
jgi:hypothetical protein